MNNRVDQTALKFNQASIIVLLVVAFFSTQRGRWPWWRL